MQTSKKVILVTALFLLMGLWLTDSFGQRPASLSKPRKASQASFDTQAFNKEVKVYFNLLHLPGLSVAVVQDGKVIYRQMEGFADVEKQIPVTEDHIFHLAPLTKSVTAALMMQYEQEGKASLEDYLLQYPFLVYGRPVGRIQDPNLKLKHFLSHTSEGKPGTAFVYNGSRYNFVYGVFEKINGQQNNPFPQEIVNRVVKPLHLTSTITGAPSERSQDSILNKRVVKSYYFNKETKTFIPDNGADFNRVAYPGAGLLASMPDLVAYTIALDQHKIISPDSYRKITIPFPLASGKVSPYGIGWFVQSFAGHTLHWGYGYGDSNSALLLRVPEQKLSFILMTNSGNASGPFRLGYGDILRSPFAISFIKHFLLSGATQKTAIDYSADAQEFRTAFRKAGKQRLHPIYTEELFTRALVHRQQAVETNTAPAKAIELVQLLRETDPDRFNQSNYTLLFLLSELASNELSPVMEQVIRAYESKGYLHPEAHYDIAQYYEKRKQPEKSLHYYQQLASHPDYQEQQVTISTNTYLGNYYMKNNQPEKARQYLWQAIKYANQVGYNNEFTMERLQEMYPEKKQ